MRISPDSRTVYVYNALDFEVAAFDAERMERTGAVSVCENPLGESVLLGKRLFYSALQPMSGRRWIACSSVSHVSTPKMTGTPQFIAAFAMPLAAAPAT